MNNNYSKPHPSFLETLFAHKHAVLKIFKEVIGVNNIHHIAITRIDKLQQILSFSSTPALEFNLFNSQLWQFDLTYSEDWYRLETKNYWDELYQASHYRELYYMKQRKHHYHSGWSRAFAQEDKYYIYSIASTSEWETPKDFDGWSRSFDTVGDYCKQRLDNIFSLY